jgi:hypothetical protein
VAFFLQVKSPQPRPTTPQPLSGVQVIGGGTGGKKIKSVQDPSRRRQVWLSAGE